MKKLFPLVAGLAMVGCQNQPAPTPTLPAKTPDFALTLAPASLSLTAGSGGKVALKLERSNGFDGAIQFAVSGAILGTGPTKADATIANASLNVEVGAGVPAGEYPLTVKATSGSIVRSADLKLTVAAAPASFSISYPAATLTVASGSPPLTLSIPIARQGGFAGAVDFSLEGGEPVVGPIGPGRINGSTSSEPGDTAKMVLTVDATVPSGTYALTIRGSSAGTSSTAALNLKVVTAQQIQADDTAYSLGLRGKNGQQFPYLCPANIDLNAKSVWGTDTYTDDTTICRAAVHAGKITQAGGGLVTIEIGPGLAAYTGSSRNGVTSKDWGKWEGSYSFK